MLVLAASIIACGVGSAACAGLLGFEHLTEGVDDGASPEASIEAATDAPGTSDAEAGGSQCSDLGVPARPKVVDAGAADAPEQVHMALNVLDFGLDMAAPAEGLNLDLACSTSTANNTCKTSIDELTFDKFGKDKNDKGLDNAGFSLLKDLANLAPSFEPTAVNGRLAAGEFGGVIRLSNWNGTPEDENVLVELFPAIGVLGADGDAGGTPTFTASDQWARDPRFKNIVDASIISSSNAWVTGGRLVAPFQTATLPISVPDDKKPVDVILREAYMTGTLVPDGASWKLDKPVLSGRWRTVDMLDQLGPIYIKNTAGVVNKHICDPDAITRQIYNAVKKEVCDARDIRSTSSDDTKQLPCDAFSAGIKFGTYAVDSAGPFAELRTIDVRCQADGSIMAGDDCAPAFP
jgi:hypothetical protein